MKRIMFFALYLCLPLLSAAQPCSVELGADKIPCLPENWMSGDYDTVYLGDALQVSGVPPFTWRWEKVWAPDWLFFDWYSTSDHLGDTTIANPMVRTETLWPGRFGFSLTVTDSNGCVASDTVHVVLIEGICSLGDIPVYIAPGDTAQVYPNCGLHPHEYIDIAYHWQPDSTLVDPYVGAPLAFPSQTTRYSYTISYGNGCYGAPLDGKTVVVRPLSTEGKDSKPEISVLPNPVTDWLNFKLSAPLKYPITVELFSLTGQRVLHTMLLPPLEAIQIGHLPVGLYLVKLTLEDGRNTTQRIVITK